VVRTPRSLTRKARCLQLVETTVTDRNAHCRPGFQYPPFWSALNVQLITSFCA
jgi:hypothetical protein